MANELYLQIKKDLITVLKAGNTLAGNNVKGGRTIPLDNPLSDYATSADGFPVIIVQMKKLQYDNTGNRGQRAQFSRVADFQIDGYLIQDDAGAETANKNIEEHQDDQLDLFCSQIMEIISYYNLLNDNTGNRYAQIYPEDIVKNEITNNNGTLLGSVSLRVRAEYQQDRNFEQLQNLEDSFNTLKNGADGTISKIIQLEV